MIIPNIVEEIEEKIAKKLHVDKRKLRGRVRGKRVQMARVAVWKVLYDQLGFPYADIGYIYDGRCHSTIIKGIETGEKNYPKVLNRVVNSI